jgi:hypothetical protein
MASSCTVLRITSATTETESFTTPPLSLHDLCQNCIQFAERWEILDWFQDAPNEHTQSWPYSTLICSVASLVENQQVCHLCNLLIASLHRWRFIGSADLTNKNVYLHAREVEKSASIHALFSDKPPMREEDGKHFASFELKTYCGE